MPILLRQLFANVLTLCCAANPRNLRDKFKGFMMEDYLRNGISQQNAEMRVLHCINYFLEGVGKNVTDFGLVDLDLNVTNDDSFQTMIVEETTNINVDPGGTGKTYFYKALLTAVRSQNLIALATASSGVVAPLLQAGRTGHSRFKISLQISSDMCCSVSKQSELGKLLSISELIIWDKAPMVHKYAFEVLDKMLKDITESPIPFGGKVIVCGGDFLQVLPVVQRRTKEDITKASLVFSHLWPSFTRLPLIQNMRAKLDPSFSEYLLKIGNGIEREHSCQMIMLPQDITINFENEFKSLKELINIVFLNFQTYGDNLNIMMNRVILTPKNEYLDLVNNIFLKEIPVEKFTYFSF
ncbi:uncharacterized protein LOC111379169 [Olea europaea var. sylvestris]|uniref:uncharacterized protein LOC111379169 n=1 Tax=Olea europaea var. sylvestris TaxID=158386 RepID=UPI000C1D7143|nr:uncharacterized protein LOC111379169 [Olea europaea var. sylvestris]